MKQKRYVVYEAGGAQIGTINATCITKAAVKFIDDLARPAGGTYALDSRSQARIRYSDNHSILSDFVVMEV